ncbi:MAG: hypothetical protein IJ010_06270 [Ruminococcus sp.]|nr:hypothetical protein [Ruminococcus sp.]
MKKLITFTLTILMTLCMVSCSVPLKSSTSRKNGLDCAFQADAAITLDRLQAEGIIRRFGTGAWEIEFSAPNTLSGVKLEFSEGNTEASYKGLSFSVPQSAVPVKAMLLNLIKAVDDSARLEELKGEEKDNVLEVSGKLEGGEYVLIVDKDGKLAGFEMDNNKLKMTFTNLTPVDAGAESASSAETTTIPAETTTVSASETMAEVTTTADVSENTTETTGNQ